MKRNLQLAWTCWIEMQNWRREERARTHQQQEGENVQQETWLIILIWVAAFVVGIVANFFFLFECGLIIYLLMFEWLETAVLFLACYIRRYSNVRTCKWNVE